MRRRIPVILLGISLTAVAPMGTLLTPRALAAAPAAHAQSKSLGAAYKATFKSLKGWKTTGDAGFKTAKGTLQYTGTGQAAIRAPFKLNGMHDFAVVMQIKNRGLAAANQTAYDYGFFVREQATFGSGIAGFSAFAQDPTLNGPEMAWSGGDSVAGNDVEPTSGFNTYRLEVHGSDYTFSIDGKQVVSFTIPGFDTGSYIGVFTDFSKITVKSFTVVKLTGATKLPTSPPVAQVNLNQSDLPSGYLKTYGHYFTNAELAHQRNVPLATVTQSGNLLSYKIEYTSDNTGNGTYVDSTVSAYDTSTNARADYTALQQAITTARASQAGWVGQAYPGIGDQAWTYQTQLSDPTGTPYTEVGVLFTRGSYRVVVSIDLTHSGAPTDTEAALLSKIVTAIDARIQHLS